MSADECRPVEVDGEIILVRGGREMTAEDREAFAEVIRAAKAKYFAEDDDLIECPHWAPGRVTLRKGCTACAAEREARDA